MVVFVAKVYSVNNQKTDSNVFEKNKKKYFDFIPVGNW